MPASDDYKLEILKDVGLVAHDQIEEARLAANDEGDSVINMLIKKNAITQFQLTQVLASHAGMDTISLRGQAIPQNVIDAVPRHIARQYKAIPVFRRDDSIAIAISDPTNLDVVDSLHYALKCEIEPMVAPKEEIDEALIKYYGDAEETVEKMSRELSEDTMDIKTRELGGAEEETADDAPIIKLVHLMIGNAHKLRASDIHIEPLEKRLRVRFRIDGELQEIDNPPKRLQASIISRIKIMSNMSIAEKRLPQDGRIQMKVMNAHQIDLRVSTVPSTHGEGIVMRILDKEGLKLGLPELGFLSDDQATFERLIAMPDGILLVTGPTGSGKTTTLYGCLNLINRPDRKIITVEDPVEYEMPGINQVAVNETTGLTFAVALRAMLRQAPNIVMIGEIRDKETADIAVNASLTGHLVFSTLHTNDAPSAVTRLIDMGVKPFLVSSSIQAIMAQRLVRKICVKCKTEYSPSEGEIQALKLSSETVKSTTFYKGAGCPDCNKTGYRGRAGIFEIFILNNDARKSITGSVSAAVIRRRARELGMRSLREDGVRKILAGMTTPEEVLGTSLADED